MNKTTIVLVLGALLLAPLASAQDNRAEPNTNFDLATGALTPTASAGATPIEYFDMYVYCDTPGFAPREATGGNFICPGTVRYSLVWGEWTDANGDGCIGSCGAILVSGDSFDDAFNTVAPVTRVYAAGNLNNDGNYDVEAFLASQDLDDLTQNEYRPIGPGDAAHQPSPYDSFGTASQGTNNFQIHDAEAVAWIDFRAPGQGAGTRCLVPVARGTFASVEGMYTYVDDFTFDRLSQNGLGAADLGIDGNTVAGQDVSAVWLADDVERAYNSSETDDTDPAAHENDEGFAPTFDRFYHDNLENQFKVGEGEDEINVFPSSNQPTFDYILYQDLEQDGCNAATGNMPDKPEGAFVYTAGVYMDSDAETGEGDGNFDIVLAGAGWASNTQIIFSPVGAHPLGTLSNGAYYTTAYGYRSGLGGKTSLVYTNVASTSQEADQAIRVPAPTEEDPEATAPKFLWYKHPVSWRDVDCLDDEVAPGTYMPEDGGLLNNAVKCA